eukprot:240625-Chlamydomonas_euryale.AAC.3
MRAVEVVVQSNTGRGGGTVDGYDGCGTMADGWMGTWIDGWIYVGMQGWMDPASIHGGSIHPYEDG